MSTSPDASGQELRVALSSWEAALAELLGETNRIAAGGQHDAAHLVRLKAEVEFARERCERLVQRT